MYKSKNRLRCFWIKVEGTSWWARPSCRVLYPLPPSPNYLVCMNNVLNGIECEKRSFMCTVMSWGKKSSLFLIGKGSPLYWQKIAIVLYWHKIVVVPYWQKIAVVSYWQKITVVPYWQKIAVVLIGKNCRSSYRRKIAIVPYWKNSAIVPTWQRSPLFLIGKRSP